MKTRISYFLLALPLVLMASCDSWLDVDPKGKVVLTTAEEYAQLLDNAAMYRYNMTDAEYLNDEIWINPLVLVINWETVNIFTANTLYLTDFDRSENASTSDNGVLGGGSFTFFEHLYQHITRVANTILYEKDNMHGTDIEIKHLVAQAKMLRAYSYFHLINYYAKPYDPVTADSDGGVPLRTDHFIEEKPEPAKATVAQVYAQIQKDINEAVEDLPENAVTPYRFNKAAGYAFKAKVHLFKKEFDDCISAALRSYEMNHYTYDLPSIVNPATYKPTVPIYATGEENLYFNTTKTTYFLLHPELVQLYKAGLTAHGQGVGVTDVRLDMHQQPVEFIRDYLHIMQYIPSEKEYSTNSIGLRTTEVMLMLGECYARKGQNDLAKQYLKPYFESRYRNYVHDDLVLPANVTDAVKFVIAERRKELTMGINRFMDLKRLNTEPAYQVVPKRTIPADAGQTPEIPQLTYELPVNSPLYIIPFPAKVLANDPRLESNTW